MSYALITGASKGIGKSIATALAQRKINVLLVSRSAGLLKELADSLKKQYGVETDYLAIDLSMPDASKSVYNWVQEKKYPVHILVNNAGYGLWGRFDNLGLEEQNNMIQLNISVPVNLTYAMLPLLKANNKAYILNIASITAYQALPTLSVYAASKAFVLSFTRGLKYELKTTNVSVTCISPGPTDTDFVNRANMEDAVKKKAEKFNMTPDAVAEIAVKGMFKGKTEIIPGVSNYLGAQLASLAPKWLVEKIAAGIYE
jgi:short-subunit dehydrogenase